MDHETKASAPQPYPAGSQPPSYAHPLPEPTYGGLTSVDFIPACTKSGGVFTWAEYERFPVVLQRANDWLSKNPGLHLRTCETVEFNTRSSGEIVNMTESVSRQYGESANRYVRGLRLWLQPRQTPVTTAQQIGYMNIMPQVRVGFFNVEAAERLDTLVAQANSMFTSTNPLQGSIITIETVALRVGSNGVDPDNTAWTERGASNEYFVYMLRIFYEVGPPAYETIGIADFVPGVLGEGGLFSRPTLERFPQVLAKAHSWLLSQPPQQRVVSMQTLFYKQKWTTHMDTLRMTYAENDLHAYYVRYLRVAYAMANPNVPPRHPYTGPVRLNCKLFTPGMLEPPGCCTVGSYETQLQVRERMSGWMKATGAKVVSVETLPMRIFSGAEQTEGFDTMHTWNAVHTTTTTHANSGIGHGHGHGHGHGNNGHHHHTEVHKSNETYLMLYRVYVDGIYNEPPGFAEAGMNVEQYMQQRSQCVIL